MVHSKQQTHADGNFEAYSPFRKAEHCNKGHKDALSNFNVFLNEEAEKDDISDVGS